MTKILIDRATAEQVLELIERLNMRGWILADFETEVYATLNSLKAALEQPPLPVQEPVAWITPDGEGFRIRFSPPTSEVPLGWDALYTTPPLPVQPEPLEYWNAVEGWVKIDEVREHFDAVNCGTTYKHGGEGRVPLYTAPPQRQWVGLMEQDMPSGEDPMFDHRYFIAGLVYAAKVLKEKNT